MLRSCGKKLLLSLVGSMLTCFLVLVVDQQKRQVLRLGGGEGFLLQPFRTGAAAAATEAWLRRAGGAAAGQSSSEVQSFTAYFSQLSRGKRELRPPGRPEEVKQRPQLEALSPLDVFIAVKSTKKFHQARLELLLETWIARNKEMVSS